MFSGAQGSAERATVFADGQPVGSTHWIEWRTKVGCDGEECGASSRPTIQFASRRAFSNFKLLAKKQSKWVEIAQYSPSLPYGGSCATDPCLPPAVKFPPGTVLAACVNVNTPVAAERIPGGVCAGGQRAGRSSPVRACLQLDGYKNADCK